MVATVVAKTFVTVVAKLDFDSSRKFGCDSVRKFGCDSGCNSGCDGCKLCCVSDCNCGCKGIGINSVTLGELVGKTVRVADDLVTTGKLVCLFNGFSCASADWCGIVGLYFMTLHTLIGGICF